MMIELTENEALAFRLLSQSGAWNLKKGSATIHFDENGRPTAVETKSWTVLKIDPSGNGYTVVV